MTPGSRLSVVIPTRGRPAVLRRVLERALAELPGPEDEAVVVHDGEEGEPDLGSRHPRLVQAATPVRGGPAAARNLGAELARGDLLLFLDDDVEPAPGALAAMRAELLARPGAAVVARIEPAPGIPRSHYLRFAYSGIAHGGVAAGPVSFEHFCSSCAALGRRRFLDAGGFDATFDRPGYEDVELGFRLARDGGPILLSGTATGLHHRRMDRAWFLARCERSGAVLRRLHRLHPELARRLPAGPRWGSRALCLGGSRAWRLWRALLPLAEALPWPLARPILRATHLVGTAMAHRGLVGPAAGPGGE